MGCSNLTSITIPNSVTIIGSDIFEGCSENIILMVFSGSYAEDYAKENNLNYSILEKEPVYGDVDGNDIVDSQDAALVLSKVLNLSFEFPTPKSNADVSGDGCVTAYDASNILQKVLNSEFLMPIERK